MSSFSQCLVHHLTRIKSDYRPLLLSTKLNLGMAISRPFKFLARWMLHNTFPTFVKEKWNFSGNMADSLSNFTSSVKVWNMNVYGFLGTRKRNLKRALNNIQNAFDHFASSHLAKKDMDVRDELENVLKHEDLLWKQKAWCDWFQLGDCNTKFYHSQTIKRRKFNRITSLCLDNEDWCSDQDILQSNAVEFFERLYGESPYLE
ncbi:hypothetical protein PVK06_031466 [Gossypium arboreum]|uniref:Reverse transcriptase n=1 Tax=Gossypium arboreum TaxID=29729 RepID=A0ABR0NR42_GOSAR|nr:hypothetical protein PVK06_031466 [Gossypium arboreum]